MKCRLCRKPGMYKVKGGKICEDCYTKLPVFIREDIRKIPVGDLKVLSELFSKTTQTSWYRYGEVRLFEHHVMLGGSFIRIENLKDAKLTFIPRKEVGNGVYGEICLIITTVYKDYSFRIPIGKTVLMTKIVNGKLYVKYPKEMEELLLLIKKGIAQKTFVRMKSQHKREEHHQQYRQQKKGNQNLLEEALSFFQLSLPFSSSELKKKYRMLILKCHPDQKVVDSSLHPEDVNRYYDFLKQYAN